MRQVILFISLLLIIGCSPREKRPTVYTELIMSTIVEISLWDDGKSADLGFKEIKRIEDKFSIYKPDSEISRNELGDEARYLIRESERYKELTYGAFDIDYRHNGKYDLGGIAKGYAVDRVVQIFREKDVKKAMVNIGGNLFLIGKKSWSVGIKDPDNPHRLIGKIMLDSEAGVATSGNYERPGHIVDPKTGKSVTDVLSVTIAAPTAMEADALSTGVFVLGREKGIELIEKLPDVEGVIIDKEGIWISSGLKDRYDPAPSKNSDFQNVQGWYYRSHYDRE